MNKQAVIRRPVAMSEAISRNVHEREPDPDKGEGDWEEFADAKTENWPFLMFVDLPSGDVPAAMPGQYHVFSRRALTSLLFAATTSIDPHAASLEEKFTGLANRWHDETGFLSSPSRITGNETYLEIIALGNRVIPLILEDLKERGGNWYRALRKISGEDPVPPEAQGDVEQMKETWLQWGRERGYIE